MKQTLKQNSKKTFQQNSKQTFEQNSKQTFEQNSKQTFKQNSKQTLKQNSNLWNNCLLREALKRNETSEIRFFIQNILLDWITRISLSLTELKSRCEVFCKLGL